VLTFFDTSSRNGITFTANEALVLENEKDQKLIEELSKFVQGLPSKNQLQYIEFASDEVKLNRKSCAYHIAHNARFKPDQPTKVTILVLGEAGIGKSTLINETFRDDLPEDQKCREGVGGSSLTSKMEAKSVIFKRKVTPEEIANGFAEDTILDIEIEFIDSPGFTREELDGAAVEKLTQGILTLITDGYLHCSDSKKSSTIDVVIWAVAGSASRLPTFDELFIRSLACLVPVGIVWTRALFAQHIEEFKHWMNDRSQLRVELPLEFTHQVYARPEQTRTTLVDSFGMGELGFTLANIFNNVAPNFKSKFLGKHHLCTEADFAKRRATAYRTVKFYSAGAGVAGGSPVPYIDNIGIFLIQTSMVAQINVHYGVSLPKNIVSSMLSTIATGGSAFTCSWMIMYAVDIGVDTLKLIPGVNLLGMALSAGIAVGVTAALGIAFINGVEKLVRTNPQLLDVPEDRIEEILLAECKEQARLTLQESRSKLDEYVSSHENL
jgi:uncharacterized protein (DUF697 family)